MATRGQIVAERRHHQVGAGGQHRAEVQVAGGCERIGVALIDQVEGSLTRTVVGSACHAVGGRVEPVVTGGGICRNDDKMLARAVDYRYGLVRIGLEGTHNWAPAAWDSVGLIITDSG